MQGPRSYMHPLGGHLIGRGDCRIWSVLHGAATRMAQEGEIACLTQGVDIKASVSFSTSGM